ncbi:PKD domain-containing protein [Marivirga sp. S37H4]|uniref:PKD domain-containing protein n=1 Tax=Marivirga aurantiaca TaxID=2802615 RepID=A0A934X139_9BACT|nr:PKD domain-containing protein [Marivirga aurantiaca]MBK6267018.1 PKD domain-containing protein [Marivirga aurantiaca]
MIIESKIYAQVNANFDVGLSFCLGENIQLTNTSTNAVSYKWDFCVGDFENDPVITNNLSTAIPNSFGLKVIEESGNFYGFATVNTASTDGLYRYDFGNSLDNSPSVSFLGDFGGVMIDPEGIDITKEGTEWIGIIGYGNNGGNLTRLVWSNIESIPIATNLGNFGFPGRLRDVKILLQNNEYIVVTPYYNGNTLVRINFGNSLKNNPTISEVTQSTALTDVNLPIGLEIVKKDGSWTAILGSQNSKTISLFDLGNDILSAPNFIKSQAFGSFNNLSKLKVIQEGANFYGLITTANGPLRLVDMKSMEATDTFAEIPKTSSPTLEGIDVVKVQSSHYVFGTRLNLSRLIFERDCPSSIDFSIDENPNVSYSQSGTYVIHLTAFDENSLNDFITKEVTVTDNLAPEGNLILAEAYCITDIIAYSFTTEDAIADYEWDYDDGNSSTDISPTHQYATAGEYTVSLTVTSPEGCSNLFTQAITIYEEAVPDFSTAETTYCSFEVISFENSTPGDYGENISYAWDFNGEGASIELAPTFTFESSGEKTIRLTANVLGCETFIEKTITLIDGPQVDFEIGPICLGETVTFTNQSTGGDITGYSWDLGNGETSIDENATATYVASGGYTISLTVTNASGCENTLEKEITIYEQIINDIVVSEAIENVPFNSTVELITEQPYSITDYDWEINGQISTDASPVWTLPFGTYELNLNLTVDAGCIFTLQKEVVVATSEFPTPDFAFEDNLCLTETIQLSNTSINAVSYEWDFCIGDFETSPVISNNLSTAISNSFGLKIIQEGNSYYGFATVNTTDVKGIYRYDFGTSLDNAPTITFLGDIGGVVVDPEGLDIMKEGSEWIGIIGYRNNGGKITRVVWEDLESSPTASEIGNFGFAGRFRDVQIVKQGGNYIVVTPYYNTSTLVRIDFGTSLKNNPTIGDLSQSAALSNVEFPIGMSLMKNGMDWLLVLGSINTKTISVFDLGIDIFSEPTHIKSETFASFNNLSKLKVIQESKSFYGLITTANGSLRLVDMKSMEATDTFEEILLTSAPTLEGIDVVKVQSSHYVLGTRLNLSRLIFEKDCPSSIDYSTANNPTISYTQAGTIPITLTAYHPNGNSASITKEITVTNNQAPDISFSIEENVCIGNPIAFTSASDATITAYDWDFGDGEQSSEETPNHTYASAGTYAVKLRVQDAEGCQNIFTDSINVYAEPIPDFQTSAQGSICSQKPVFFENLTDLPTDATFLWEFGDGNSSTEENPEHIYETANDYTVSLQITMAGCMVEKQNTISVNPGPALGFTTIDNCLGQSITFNNTSQGDFITAYHWDFGDGTTSTQENPVYSFEAIGTHNISLTAFTSNGCDYTFEQMVEVYPVAVVDFETEAACATQPVQFNEQVFLEVSNITDFLWDFGIPGRNDDLSTLANPQFTFPEPGTYNVNLQVTTADGCVSEGQKIITVQPIPQPGFSYEAKCVGNTILFESNTSNNISSHYWELQNNAGEVLQVGLASDFSYQFLTAGDYSLKYRQQNQQLCSNEYEETISILPRPEPSFAFGQACKGLPVTFENTSSLFGNNVAQYNWKMGNIATLNEENPTFTFEETGNYEVMLEVITSSGCMESTTQTITVNPLPDVSFDIPQEIGAYPFPLNIEVDEEVEFSYEWTINGAMVSTETILQDTLSEQGNYIIGLNVTNSFGCTSSTFRQLNVRAPELDIALSNLRIVPQGDFTNFVITLSNKGSLVPDYIDLDVDLGKFSVTERVERIIYPGNTVNYALSLSLSESQLKGLNRICLSANVVSSVFVEEKKNNNRACTNLEDAFKVLDIYPNPAKSMVQIPVILPENGDVFISIEQSDGKQNAQLVYPLESGYNELKLERGNLKAGIYFIRIRYQGYEIVKKVVFN